MIQFRLKCDKDHQFDSWFPSNDAFDALKHKGLLSCATCGSSDIAKSLMAPAVQNAAPLTAIPDDAQTQIAALRTQIEQNADDVGTGFATEARAIHDGTAPDRAIYGQANGVEARKLIADGVPVLPLPFVPSKKVN